VRQGLQQLVEAEFLYQQGLPPQATYRFKHALIQDAAYQSLLRSTRQQYHQRIVQVLEARFPTLCETQPELLAHHATEAGFHAQALGYWQQAGQRAIVRSANLEAVSHLTRGLEILATLPETSERLHQERDLQLTLGPALMATRGYGAAEVGQTYARAHALCQQSGDLQHQFQALWGLWRFHAVGQAVGPPPRRATLRPGPAGTRSRVPAGSTECAGYYAVLSRRVPRRPRRF
jgi:predicted ATPase